MAREPPRSHRASSRRHSSGYGDRQHHRRPSRLSQYQRNSYRTDGGLSQEKLDSLNQQLGWDAPRVKRRDDGLRSSDKTIHENKIRREYRSQRKASDDFYYRNERPRVTSGVPLVEEYKNDEKRTSEHARRRRSGRHHDRQAEREHRQRRKRRKWLIVALIASIIIIIIIGVAAGLSARKNKDRTDAKPANSNLGGIDPSTIPDSAKGTYLDPFTWYDTTDFNISYTSVLIGGLTTVGLNSTWNDNVRANPQVPPLTEAWEYGIRTIRGVNLGGWLSLEPFITPSLFSTTYPDRADASIPLPYRDEYTLTSALGPKLAARVLDKHYSTFVTASTFSSIRAAGFDHIRIPYPYWAVTTYASDPYVPHISWRHLLRGIEYARLNGLRVNLDLHSAPGSQNGWNHSGRQGAIHWLSDDEDGKLNGERTLQSHSQLAEFFGQERYRNVVTLYGVLNEPNMQLLDPGAVLNWTMTALTQLRASKLPDTTILVISNGFLPLPFFHSALAPTFADPAQDGILLDAHQYVIFNPDQLSLDHSAKLEYACKGWSQQAGASMDETKGFGTFVCGEWSQADTDCARWINNVGVGARWDGTLDTGDVISSVLSPACPLGDGSAGDGKCDCGKANASPEHYSDAYKKYLKSFAEAQMRSFAQGWGSFYWTWDVEDGVPGSAQISWKKGVEAGILPADVSESGMRGAYDCGNAEDDWVAQGLGEGW